MSAYFIVLNNKQPDFETFVDGKAITREMDAIASIAKLIGVPDIHDFASFSELAAEFQIDPDLPAAKEVWFDATEGIHWTQSLRRYIEENPTSIKNPDEVIKDLKQYETVLQNAAHHNIKWHFSMDI